MAISLPRENDIADWTPSLEFAVRETPLGDGYVRISPQGINNVKRTYQIRWVTFKRLVAMDQIVTPLRETRGVELINWTPLNDIPGVWRLAPNGISYPNDGTLDVDVSATLIEHFST